MSKLTSGIQLIRLILAAGVLVVFLLLGLAFAYAAIMYAVTRSDWPGFSFWSVVSALCFGVAYGISRGMKTLLLSLRRT